MINIETIFWDFDGVILDSNSIRDAGFRDVLMGFPQEQIDELLAFHQENGGLSRYVKFRYFFEEIRKERVSKKQIFSLSENFSKIMLNNLINKDLLIKESLDFIKSNYRNFNMHIVSGSDEKELRKICKGLEIQKYFNTINGSPTDKNTLVANILSSFSHEKDKSLLVGDSKNDLEAARVNGVFFMLNYYKYA